MVRDITGNFYVAGNQYIAKYNSIGNFIWQQSINGFGVNGIDVDSIGNLYVTGMFYGTVTLGSFSLTSDVDHSDLYLAKFNTSGTIEWITRSYNNSGFAGVDAITVNEQCYPIIIGRFLDSLKLDNFVFHGTISFLLAKIANKF